MITQAQEAGKIIRVILRVILRILCGLSRFYQAYLTQDDNPRRVIAQNVHAEQPMSCRRKKGPTMRLELATLPTTQPAHPGTANQSQNHPSVSTDESASLQIFRRAIQQRDELAWEEVYQRWKRLLLRWLFQHPAAKLALTQEPPEHFVTAALSRFWQATACAERPAPAFATLAGTLAYLRRSLNSAVLDAVRQARAYQHEVYETVNTEEVGSPPPEAPGGDLWQCIERALPKRRERLLVYLRYVQGYRPREIAATYSQEFPSVGEVYRLERMILGRLSRHPALAGWKEYASSSR